MKQFLIAAIVWYQTYISPDQSIFSSFKKSSSNHCAFYPTCSEYTKQAILKYGAGLGVWYGLRRIIRCHPWQKNHNDPLV